MNTLSKAFARLKAARSSANSSDEDFMLTATTDSLSAVESYKTTNLSSAEDEEDRTDRCSNDIFRGFPLQDLPAELIILMVPHLDWSAIQDLRLTSRKFASSITLKIMRKEYGRCHDETAAHDVKVDSALRIYNCKAPVNREWLTLSPQTIAKRKSQNQLTLLVYHPDKHGMPCYRCLRWFQFIDMEVSVFSYGGVPVPRRDNWPWYWPKPPRYITRSRFCFDCGVKNGHYPRGSRWKGRIICVGCGQLGRRMPSVWRRNSGGIRYPLWTDTVPMRFKYYCDPCNNAGLVPGSFAEAAHDKFEAFCRYEKTMYRKWEETKEKRRKLEVPVGDEGNKWEVWCPILQRKAVCKCAKSRKKWEKYFDRIW